MHELSIAQAVVSTVRDHVGTARVTQVSLRVGVLAGVVPDSLHFCWELATADTPLAGAELVIERVPLTGSCLECGRESVALLTPLASCEACGGSVLPTSGGRELEVASVEVEDEDPAAAEPPGQEHGPGTARDPGQELAPGAAREAGS